MLAADRGEAHAAIAEGDGRGAVPRGRCEDRIPGRLAIIMGVHIDPARRDQPAVGLDLAPTGTGLAADLDDLVAVDGDVAVRSGRSCAVNDGAAPDDDVVHGPSCFSSERPRAFHTSGATGRRMAQGRSALTGPEGETARCQILPTT